MKVQVQNLKEGDDLGTCVIAGTPIYMGNYCGQRDRMQVKVRYGSGVESNRVWGKSTTVTVTNR